MYTPRRPASRCIAPQKTRWSMELKILAGLASVAALAYAFGDLLAAHLRERRRELIIAEKQDILDAYRDVDEIEDIYDEDEEERRSAVAALERARAKYRAFQREQAREQQVASR